MNLARSSVPFHFAVGLTAFVFAAATHAEDRFTPDQIAFFETKIRPVLVEHCQSCHSAEAETNKKLKGGLRLDSRLALLKGGDSGPAVEAGKPATSLLMKAIRQVEGVAKMPPKGKLPDAAIADFERWIALGAAAPDAGPAVPGGSAIWDRARQHWAFQPVKRPSPPTVKDGDWARTPLDLLVLAGLEAKGLTPSPAADRRTLIRRVYFDLVGMPPMAAEVAAFIGDRTPEAFARVVERLLASPQYGERWGRHWLDVARYADSKDGVLMYGDDRVRPYAYTYRDYVVRALNEDLPYNRFVREQLAADLIEPKVEPRRLAAMGFLTLGRMFDNNIHDVIDDRIDTVSRGLLGLTVSCARCHDHKYDPVPSADYYSLYGVFASSIEPLVRPIIGESDDATAAAAFDKQFAPKQREVQEILDRQYTLLLDAARRRVADYHVHAVTTKPDPLETAIYFLSLAPEDLRPPIVARWRTYLARRAVSSDPVFGPWSDLMALPEADFSTGVTGVLERWRARPTGTAAGQLNPLIRDVLTSPKFAGRADVARAYGTLIVRVFDTSLRADREKVDADAATRQILEIITGRDSPAYFPKSQTHSFMSRTDKDGFGNKVQELDRLAVQSKAAPPRAMMMTDAQEMFEPTLFVRGDPARPGAPVPRQFLKVVQGAGRKPFPHGSGRLDLANAIAAPDNPLTSRVLVNRVWMHHFGEPLVESPSDFGLRTAKPANPGLLDYLAATFVDGDWSMKALHRTILLSATYQQASADRPSCREIDPENKLQWRMNRRRLDLESMRDSMLAVSGRLDPRMGGRPADVVGDSMNGRRTVYGMVDRQSLPGLYRAFDFASPDLSADRRPLTTVPQQALFGMNSPFMIEQAKALAGQPEIAAEKDAAKKIHRLYRRALGRDADESEVLLGRAFVAASEASRASGTPSPLDSWSQFAQVLLLTNELMFVD